MAALVSSRSSDILISSEKEKLNYTNDVLNSHYSFLEGFQIEDDSLIDSLPSLYFSEETKKEDIGEDTEDDDDENMPSNKLVGKTPSPFKHINASSKFAFLEKSPLLSFSKNTQLNPLTIQTYSPQLNHSLYSPASSIGSSIKSRKNSFCSSTFCAAAACSSTASLATTCTTINHSPLNTTATEAFDHKKITPLYSICHTPDSSSSSLDTNRMGSSIASTAASSGSRFRNPFQRFKPKVSNASTNSILPVEFADTAKTLNAKNTSLADKIKSKLQQQLDKTKIKNRSSLVELPSTKKKLNSGFSMPRSSSLSSLSNWSSKRLQRKNSSKATGLSSSVTMSNLQSNQMESSHSISSSAVSFEKDSDSINSFEPIEKKNKEKKPSAFSITKSISSHKLYHKSNNDENNDQQLKPVRSIDDISECIQSVIETPKKQRKGVSFKKLVSVRETYSKEDYDRSSDSEAICTRLTPLIAQQIKDELNDFKLHEMEVHERSRQFTHFFI